MRLKNRKKVKVYICKEIAPSLEQVYKKINVSSLSDIDITLVI